MPITMNQFHCSNGHDFEANAKLRTRCPECGVSTKRSFDSIAKIVTEKLEAAPEPKTEPVEKPKPTPGPVLIRQGRPRMSVKKPTPPKKPTIIGSKASGGLVSRHRITTRGTMPTIKKRPVKTAIARGVNAGKEQVKLYWHEVADRYGF